MAYKMGVYQTGLNEKIFLRKYRWVYTPLIGNLATAPNSKSICFLSSRPKITMQEQVINHMHETISYPSRAMWDPIELSFFSIAGDTMFADIIKRVYNFENHQWGFYEEMVFDSRIEMVDGRGNICESWLYQGCWPMNVDMGELDYNTNELSDVRLTLKYSRVKLESSQVPPEPQRTPDPMPSINT